MVQDLRHTLTKEKAVSGTMQNVNTAKVNLCISCVIAPGAAVKSDSRGSPDLFLKYAIGADGL
jgi:hypothetical protein